MGSYPGIHRQVQASCGFPDEKAQKEDGGTEEASGKKERIGVEMCKGKELTK